MPDSTVTLIIGIAGLLATAFTSFLGFFYADKARKDKYQHAVFTEQFEIFKRANLLVGRAQNFVVMVAPPRGEFFDRAIEDIRLIVPDIADIVHEGSSLLPTEIWIDLKQFNDALIAIIEQGESGAEIDAEQVAEVNAQAATFALATRTLLGVDELSEATLKIIAGKSPTELLSKAARHEIRANITMR